MDKFDELAVEMAKADLYAKIAKRMTNLNLVAIALRRDMTPADISRAVAENIKSDNDIIRFFGNVNYDNIINSKKN